MRRILGFVLAAFMLLTAVIPAYAEVAGLQVNENDKFEITRSFEAAPLSFEAWINVPVGAGRAGVIVGNYAGSTACINFEITTNGRPRLYVVEFTSGEKVIHDITFKSVDIRSNDMVHVAVTHDAAKAESYCYVNGVLKETLAGAINATEEVCKYIHVLGGDRRSGNGQYFKGTIGEVALFKDTRTADEIKSDMDKISLDDKNLLAWYDCANVKNDKVEDKSGNGYAATKIVKWMDSKEAVSDYAYSFCVVGDTQVVAKNYPEKLSAIYDWIIENKDEKKIEFVFGLGDITDKNTDEEWTVARDQIFRLNGVVPYSLVRGNHDGTAKINEYMAKLDYMSQFDGFYENGKMDNSWRTFTVGEIDYLLITLDYGASDSILKWAADIIESHPTHKVIITTHCYLFRDGTTLDVGDVCPPNASGDDNGTRNNGDQMWDKLVSKYPNIFLVLSGHDPCENVIATQTKGINGNVVTQMLIDPQGVDSAEGGTGMIAMLYFSEDGKTLSVEQYSTVQDKYYMNTSQFEIPLPSDFYGKTSVDVPVDEPADDKEVTTPVETSKDGTNEPEEETHAAEGNGGGGASIGIIGGADGPTAIFVATTVGKMIVPVVVAAVVGFVAGLLVGKKSKKK